MELINGQPYIEQGYKNRTEYLFAMSEEYDVPIETVYAVAELLGRNEDFDGLISALEDYNNDA